MIRWYRFPFGYCHLMIGYYSFLWFIGYCLLFGHCNLVIGHYVSHPGPAHPLSQIYFGQMWVLRLET